MFAFRSTKTTTTTTSNLNDSVCFLRRKLQDAASYTQSRQSKQALGGTFPAAAQARYEANACRAASNPGFSKKC